MTRSLRIGAAPPPPRPSPAMVGGRIDVDYASRNVAMAQLLGFDAINLDEPVGLAGKLRVRGLPA